MSVMRSMSGDSQRSITLPSLIPKRWEVALLLFSGIVVVYTLRVNMSVAVQKMCEELHWTESQKGLVLSAFYWGYALGQLPASRIAQLYGARHLFGWSVALPSFLTILVPVSCRSSFAMALFIRMLIGFFESATFPAFFHFIPIWIPPAEKTFTVAFIASGMYFGEIIGFGLSGFLASSSDWYIGELNVGGWASIFYIFGIAGLLWFPFWLLRAYESPQDHPYISREELILMIGEASALKVMEHGTNDANDSKNIDHVNINNDEEKAGAGDQTAAEAEEAEDTVVVDLNDTMLIIHPMHEEEEVIDDSVHNPIAEPLLDSLEIDATINAKHDDDVIDSTANKEEGKETIEKYNDSTTRRRSKASADNIQYTRAELAAGTPWNHFLSHPISIGLLMGSFCYGWIGFTLLSEMPSYLTQMLGFDLQSAGILCVFPYLALFISSLVNGQLFLYLQRECHWSLRSVRLVATLISNVGGSVGLVLCGFMSNKYVAYSFMILTQACYSAAQAGIGCAYTDIAPNYSSSLNSLGNTLGAIAGILGPIIVSALIESEDPLWGWRAAFLLTFAISAVVCTYWIVVMKFRIVPILNKPVAAVKET